MRQDKKKDSLPVKRVFFCENSKAAVCSCPARRYQADSFLSGTKTGKNEVGTDQTFLTDTHFILKSSRYPVPSDDTSLSYIFITYSIFSDLVPAVFVLYFPDLIDLLHLSLLRFLVTDS